MQQTQQSLLIAALLALGLVLLCASLLRGSGPPDAVEVSAMQPELAQPDGVQAPPVRVRAVNAQRDEKLEEGPRRRLDFADKMNKRYRRRGMPRQVSADGEKKQVLSITWTAEPSADDVRELMRAKPLLTELKSQGFKRFIVKHGKTGKELWNKEL